MGNAGAGAVFCTDVNVLHLTDWDDTTEYVRKEGLAIYVNPSPYPRG